MSSLVRADSQFDFRNVFWGMTKNEVRLAEFKPGIINENKSENSFTVRVEEDGSLNRLSFTRRITAVDHIE